MSFRPSLGCSTSILLTPQFIKHGSPTRARVDQAAALMQRDALPPGEFTTWPPYSQWRSQLLPLYSLDTTTNSTTHDGASEVSETKTSTTQTSASTGAVSQACVEQGRVPCPLCKTSLVGKAGLRYGTLCSYPLLSMSDQRYRRHMKRKHPSGGHLKPLQCVHHGCGYRCYDSKDMRRHNKRHSGERDVSCPSCNRRFSRVDNMRRHQRKAHQH